MKWIGTESFIICNGKRIYLDTTFTKLENLICDNSPDTIKVVVSGLIVGKPQHFLKNHITSYGRV